MGDRNVVTSHIRRAEDVQRCNGVTHGRALEDAAKGVPCKLRDIGGCAV